MAPNVLLLGLLATALFAGCLGPSANLSHRSDAATATHPTTNLTADAPVAVPPCKDGNNYGSETSIGDYTLVVGGPQYVLYKESNGKAGLQTREDCPADHDMIVSEAHPTWAQGAPATDAAGCKANHTNYGIEVSMGKDLLTLEPDALVWYHESNNLAGIQTRGDCPVGHDAILTIVPTVPALPESP